MPPRSSNKRKASSNAASSKLAAAAARSQQLQCIPEDVTQSEDLVSEDANQTLLNKKLLTIDVHVQSLCQELMAKARAAAAEMRSGFDEQLLRMGKKLRETPVTALLDLNPEEVDASTLGPALARLARLLAPTATSAAEVADEVAAAERDNAEAAATTDVSPPATATAVAPDAAVATATAMAAAPAVPSRGRVSRGGEQRVAACAASTPVAGRNNRNNRSVANTASTKSLLATPAALTSAAEGGGGAGVGAGRTPGTSRLTGFSLTTRTLGRTGVGAGGGSGRGRGAASATDDAIMITTYDGQQFMVDGDLGLEGVPAQYRVEVGQQLEVMQRLVAAALARRG